MKTNILSVVIAVVAATIPAHSFASQNAVLQATEGGARICGEVVIAARHGLSDAASPEKLKSKIDEMEVYIQALEELKLSLQGSDKKSAEERIKECNGSLAKVRT